VAANGRNGVAAKVVGVVFGVALVAILTLSFTNQVSQASHNSAEGPHGRINTDIAEIKMTLRWIREHMEHEQ